jgi:Holliday junction resolvase RusA-like endonuclease
MRLSFFAAGTPVTQGSVRAYVAGGVARVVSKTPPLVEWRDVVRLAAHQEKTRMGLDVATGPASVTLAFYLPRPASKPKTIDVFPFSSKTDLDKYVRAVLDAITNAGVWTDDNRVVDLAAKKRYAVGPELPRIYDPAIHVPTPGVQVGIEWLSH